MSPTKRVTVNKRQNPEYHVTIRRLEGQELSRRNGIKVDQWRISKPRFLRQARPLPRFGDPGTAARKPISDSSRECTPFVISNTGLSNPVQSVSEPFCEQKKGEFLTRSEFLWLYRLLSSKMNGSNKSTKKYTWHKKMIKNQRRVFLTPLRPLQLVSRVELSRVQ